MYSVFTVRASDEHECIRVRDKRMDDVSLHTYMYKYSDFLVGLISVGLASSRPNHQYFCVDVRTFTHCPSICSIIHVCLCWQTEDEQQAIIKEVFHMVSRRDDTVCNFLEGPT